MKTTKDLGGVLHDVVLPCNEYGAQKKHILKTFSEIQFLYFHNSDVLLSIIFNSSKIHEEVGQPCYIIMMIQDS